MRVNNRIVIIFILFIAFTAYLFCYFAKSDKENIFLFDDRLALFVNNQRVDSLEKDITYYLDTFVCSNNEDVSYDSYSKKLTVRAVNKNTRCKLYFNFETTVEYDYSGDEKTYKIPKDGYYKLEAWGAEGGYGYNETYRGGYGGYSAGIVYLTKGTILKINVGGKGLNSSDESTFTVPGGYNGGGEGIADDTTYIGSGGGASHIAIVSGILTSLINKETDLLIVAPGGGGGAYKAENDYGIGGSGGGCLGVNGTYLTEVIPGTAGLQTNGGSSENAIGIFGAGGSSISVGAGGGSGYFGGGAGTLTGGAGGGSGYIGNLNPNNRHMSCYGCEEFTVDLCKTSAAAGISEIPTSDYAKKGNGYIKIIYLEQL